MREEEEERSESNDDGRGEIERESMSGYNVTHSLRLLSMYTDHVRREDDVERNQK